MKILKRIGSISLISIIGIFLIIPVISLIMFSIKDYDIFRGLMDSPSVGFDNFSKVLSYDEFAEAFGRSALISIVSLFIGAIYVFLSSLVTGSIKPTPVKAVTAFFFALPAIIPHQLILQILYITIGQSLKSPSTVIILNMFLNSLPLAAIVSLASFFVKEKPVKEALKYCLIFVAIRLILFFTVDFFLVYGLQNVYTIEYTEIIETLLYRTGIQNGNYSVAAAAYILKYLFQLLPAALGCFILILMKKKFGTNDLTDSKLHFTPLAILPVIALFIITWIIAIPFILFQSLEALQTGYINSFLINSLSALICTIIAVFLAKSGKNIGIAGIILLALFTIFSSFNLGQYMNVRNLGFVNTIYAPIVHNMNLIPIIALILYYVVHSCNSSVKDGSLFAMTYGITFVYFWQDYISTLFYTTNRSLFPAQYILMQLLKESSLRYQLAMNEGISISETYSYFIIFTIVPILIAALCIALSVVLHKTKILAIKRNTKAEPVTNSNSVNFCGNEENISTNTNNINANNSQPQQEFSSFAENHIPEQDTLKEAAPEVIQPEIPKAEAVQPETSQAEIPQAEPTNEIHHISPEIQAELSTLKQLADAGIITNEEFEFKKKQLLGL